MYAPVITVDGPSGSGKGTLSQGLAKHLSWHLLDSGALYRLVALSVIRRVENLDEVQPCQAGRIAADMEVRFDIDDQSRELIYLDNKPISRELRSETVAEQASRFAAWPEVRKALLQKQRDFRVPPGLVADGRDMGTVVFPDADLKLFVTASLEIRVKRRAQQLKEMGITANLSRLHREMAARDERDQGREASPLRPAEDAVILDTTRLGITEVLEQALKLSCEVTGKSD